MIKRDFSAANNDEADPPGDGRGPETGCGGRNAGDLLKRYPQARLTALDYSRVSAEKQRK